jgi:hypothetical protein
MKTLTCWIVAGVLVGSVGFANRAEAGDKGKPRQSRHAVQRDDARPARYFAPRDVVVIRDYYRPYHRHHRPAHVHYVYARGGYLPPGWATRVHPIPVPVARALPPVPYGYHRGIIDGRAVVYGSGGLILDVAVLF